jgi:hypothetical protein
MYNVNVSIPVNSFINQKVPSREERKGIWSKKNAIRNFKFFGWSKKMQRAVQVYGSAIFTSSHGERFETRYMPDSICQSRSHLHFLPFVFTWGA